jgi:hypothetical protein
MLRAHHAHRPDEHCDPATLGGELARLRLEHRARRLEMVVRELRRRADEHETRGNPVPVPLREALLEFTRELAEVRRRVADAPARASADRSGSGRRAGARRAAIPAGV